VTLFQVMLLYSIEFVKDDWFWMVSILSRCISRCYPRNRLQ